MSAAQLVAHLLSITPPPPDTEDIDALVAAALTMADARTALLAAETTVALGPVDPALLAELELRHRAWNAALDDARIRVGAQRLRVGQLRHYACR